MLFRLTCQQVCTHPSCGYTTEAWHDDDSHRVHAQHRFGDLERAEPGGEMTLVEGEDNIFLPEDLVQAVSDYHTQTQQDRQKRLAAKM
jgi:hypothetical protein